jgi:hypothetical protein
MKIETPEAVIAKPEPPAPVVEATPLPPPTSPGTARFILFVSHPEAPIEKGFGWGAAYAYGSDYEYVYDKLLGLRVGALWQIVDLKIMRVIASHGDCFRENLN